MLKIKKEIYKNGYMLSNGIAINQSEWNTEMYYDDNLNYYKPVFKNQELSGFKKVDGIL